MPLQPLRTWTGVAIGQDHRNDAARRVFEELRDNPEQQFQTIVTGDMLVHGSRVGVDIVISDCILRRRTRFKPDGSYADLDDIEASTKKE